jgi:hypothetical protein
MTGCLTSPAPSGGGKNNKKLLSKPYQGMEGNKGIYRKHMRMHSGLGQLTQFSHEI